MTMIDPPSLEPVEATERKRLTGAEKAVILERQHDLCADCSESLIWAEVDGKPVYGPMIDEHILPLWLGGSNDLANRELRCVPCAKKKTKEDLERIAKTKRLKSKDDGTWPEPKRKLQGRAFSPGRNKAAAMSKTRAEFGS